MKYANLADLCCGMDLSTYVSEKIPIVPETFMLSSCNIHGQIGHKNYIRGYVVIQITRSLRVIQGINDYITLFEI